MKELGIYVHIPFCKSKCYYCNFNSYAGCNTFQPDYLKALLLEIDHYASVCKEYKVTTIYIGGGTPSNFISGGVVTILDEIRSKYNVSQNAEISIEANPNTITYDKIVEWKTAGVNRVSVGLQTDNSKLLRVINRTHTKADFLNAISLLKNNGFYNINADIMLGLPLQKLSDVKRTLKTLKKCDIPHISAYSLIVEEGTPISEMIKSGKLKEPNEIRVVKMYDFVKDDLLKLGLNRYEVSNFAKTGYECKHNLNCWKMVDYIGFGAGAHSFLNNVRHYNYSQINDYIKKVTAGGSAVEVSETQTNNDLFEEYVMLKLRTTEGINLKHINDEYNIDLMAIKKDKIEEFKKANIVEINGDFLRLTDLGFHVLNRVVLELVC